MQTKTKKIHLKRPREDSREQLRSFMRHAMVIRELDKTLERMQIRLDLFAAISQLLAGIEV